MTKRYAIITESDARTLEPGSVVELEPGGIVTPLASDTLKARRITVERADGIDGDLEALLPRSPVRTIALGSDHTGVSLKGALAAEARRAGLVVVDVGTDRPDPVDYPDVAAAVALAVQRGQADAGIVIDGAGIGSAMAANKVPGIRAAMCVNETLARYAREHNGANVLALGATLVTPEAAWAIVRAFLGTTIREPRYVRRLGKIQRLERR